MKRWKGWAVMKCNELGLDFFQDAKKDKKVGVGKTPTF